MTAVLAVEVCCEALFVSDLQRSDHPSGEKVREAVSDVVGRLGAGGCAALVAEEFGEHPDCAQVRMLRALQAVAAAFEFEAAR